MVTDLMATAKPYHIYPGNFARPIFPSSQVPRPDMLPGFAFVAYPNRDSTPYKERYNIPEAKTIIRGVRYPLICPSALSEWQQILSETVTLTALVTDSQIWRIPTVHQGSR